MAYIIIVNPATLEAAGLPKGPSMVATILAAAFGTVVMGLYTRRPFAIAPYMGENAFIAFTEVKVMTTTAGAFIESAAGIEEGGRSGCPYGWFFG
jgi:AGZA family xanthine/uracil permease-like MFS transporter